MTLEEMFDLHPAVGQAVQRVTARMTELAALAHKHGEDQCSCPAVHAINCEDMTNAEDMISCDRCGGKTPECYIWTGDEATLCIRCWLPWWFNRILEV